MHLFFLYLLILLLSTADTNPWEVSIISRTNLMSYYLVIIFSNIGDRIPIDMGTITEPMRKPVIVRFVTIPDMFSNFEGG